jgi:membrane peptidoglycan carboxypeptidase
MTLRRRELMASAVAAVTGAPTLPVLADSGPSLREPPREPLSLTLSTAQNDRFAERVREATRDVSRALVGKLLLPADAASQVDPSSSRRAVIHAMVTVNGEIRGFFSTWSPGVLKSASQGSTSKVLGAVALATARPDLLAADATWAAQPVRGLREADGTRGGGRLSAGEAVARSRNLPAAWVFSRMPDDDLRAALRSGGIEAPAGYPAAISLAFGHIQWSAMDVLCLFDAIASGSARGVNLSRSQVRPKPLVAWVARSLERSHSGAEALSTLLAGPVLHPRGTARHLKAALTGLSPIAKTGTVVNRHGENVAKVLALAFQPRPKVVAAAYVAMVSPRLNQPLGTNLPSAAFGPLHRTLIEYAKEIS